MVELESIGCCLWCKGPIYPFITKGGERRKGEKRYCGRPCIKKACESARIERPRKRAPRPGRTGRGPTVTGVCLGCGQTFSRQRSCQTDQLKYCAKACAYAARKREAIDRHTQQGEVEAVARRVRHEVLALRRIAKYVEMPAKTLRPCSMCQRPTIGSKGYSRTCAECKRKRSKAASKLSPSYKAGKRIYKARRRVVERGAQADRIDPLRVFERDRWTCHLCGCKTPASLRGSYEPNTPELDHVLPLAAGGTHTWGNVKCSCRQCNGIKGSKPMGQLGLDMAA